jgi:hypothetical protein
MISFGCMYTYTLVNEVCKGRILALENFACKRVVYRFDISKLGLYYHIREKLSIDNGELHKLSVTPKHSQYTRPWILGVVNSKDLKLTWGDRSIVITIERSFPL